MDRRAFVVGSVALLGRPLAAEAQQAGKVPRMTYIAAASTNPHLTEAFRHGLRELGWVEGQNILIDFRYADLQYDALPRLAGEVVGQKPDAIVAAGTVTAVAVSKATATIPIVMISAGDPVELGLVASLGRPGGNVTGLSFSVGMETFGKGLELLREAIPGVRRLAVLSNPANPGQPLAVRNLMQTARSLGIDLELLEARAPEDLDRAFAAATKRRVPAVFVAADQLFLAHRARLVEVAARHRLPAMHGFREVVAAGGLMSYGPSLPDIFRRAAVFADKILKGAKPADLPVEQPTKFELVINLKTAKALGLTVPPSLLLRADHVIE